MASIGDAFRKVIRGIGSLLLAPVALLAQLALPNVSLAIILMAFVVPVWLILDYGTAGLMALGLSRTVGGSIAVVGAIAWGGLGMAYLAKVLFRDEPD